jgi:protein-tyrosine kinase
MSLIESALERLRRATAEGSAAGDEGSAKSSPLPGGALSKGKTHAASVATVLPSVSDVPAKRISLDLAALRRAGYLPEAGLERRFADHYRQIKRPLIEKALAGGPEMRLILVSSALPGDGKTFTSFNLALSMARERDVSVLLIDADAPRAHISEVLGIRGEPGLMNALVDDALDVEALIQGTDVRGLDVLPAGKLVENATELLASARMQQIATRLVSRNSRRLVLFDSAPLLVSSEARVMTRIPGQVVLVARVGATPRQAVAEAASHVERSKLQGLVLNQAPFRKGAGYYEYGSYGEGDEASESASR